MADKQRKKDKKKKKGKNKKVRLKILQSDWQECVAAMKSIMSNVNGIKDDETRNSITLINKHIFCNENVMSGNDIMDDAPIETKLNGLTPNQLDDIMDEIKSESVDAMKNDSFLSNSFLSDGKRKISQESQQRLVDTFVKKDDIFGGIYKCNEISIDTISSLHSKTWNNFISIHCDLLLNDLKQLLSKVGSNNDAEYIMNKFEINRNVCGLLPIKIIALDARKPKIVKLSKDYCEMINYFENKSNTNDSLKKYLIIYNGVANMFLRKEEKHAFVDGKHSAKELYGFDSFLFSKIFNDDNNSNSREIIDVPQLFRQYLGEQMSQTGVFGSAFIRYPDDPEIMVAEDKKRLRAQRETKKCLFNDRDEYDAFKELSKYTLQDIKDASWYDSSKEHCGAVFYIINRLSYVIFHDLMIYENESKNNNNGSTNTATNNNTKDKMLFSPLIKLFKFMYHFCVYVHCFDLSGSTGSDNPMWYVKQYYNLNSTLYSNEEDYDKDGFEYNLSKFNYFCFDHFFGASGTLLHNATGNKNLYLVELLLNDGFDSVINVKNRFVNVSQQITPMELVLKQKHIPIQALFKQFNENSDSDSKSNSNEEEKMASKMESKMDSKAIEVRYDSFMTQLAAARYYLLTLGCKIKREEDIKIDIKSLGMKRGRTIKNKNYDPNAPKKANVPSYMQSGPNKTDEYIRVSRHTYNGISSNYLYKKFNQFVGLNGESIKNWESAHKFMDNLVDCVMKLLSKKVVISQDLLILSWIYCLDTYNVKLGHYFLAALRKVTQECLATKISDETESLFKQRNYQWFKHYLLNSNIWLTKLDSIANDKILYVSAVEVVNRELKYQKKFIWDNVRAAEKKDGKSFEQLLKFPGSLIKNRKSKYLRQDKIDKGIIPLKNGYDVLLMKVKTYQDGTFKRDTSHNYDYVFENNTKSYLTQCLSFAHVNNKSFQREMEKVFSNKEKYPNCKFASAPVKLYPRCVIKSTSDYGKNEFPSAACILDYIRFSVCFDDVKSLLDGLFVFVTDILSSQIKCLKWNGILRVKNGFKNITDWTDVSKAEYCDIKLNMIYKNNDGQCMIVEAQFLLKFLLKAKKMGHKLYGVVRQSDYIYNICNEIYNNDSNYDKYSFKISKMISNDDSVHLYKQLFWKPNIVLSIINFDKNKHVPLLYSIGTQIAQEKTFGYVLSCLFHLSYVLLDELNVDSTTTDNNNNNNKDKLLIQRYLNFNNCDDEIICENKFWGMNCSGSRMNQAKLSNIETIMKQSTFDGLSQITDIGVISSIMYSCVENECCDYMSLLLKYLSKNKLFVEKGLNGTTKEWMKHPLIAILQSKTESKEQLLELYFELGDKCNIVVELQALKEGINECQSLKKQEEKTSCQQLIQEYMNKHNLN